MFNFIMKKALSAQLKNLPKDQQEAIISAFERDPDFFKQMAKEIKAEVKKGKSEQTASMMVMMKHKDKLQKLMMGK